MAKDIRHLRRLAIIKEIFASLFLDEINAENFENEEVVEILSKKAELDEIISKIASKYSGEKLAKIDASVLYLSIWELIFDSKKTPYKVVINEAVEIAKELGSETSSGFVNAVLGKVYENYLQNDKN